MSVVVWKNEARNVVEWFAGLHEGDELLGPYDTREQAEEAAMDASSAHVIAEQS